MKKIFILSIIYLAAFTVSAQSARLLTESQSNKNSVANSIISNSEVSIENLSVYPNPVVDMLKISIKSTRRANAVISIFNNIGKQVYSQESSIDQGNNLLNIDVRSKAIEPGIYFIQLVVEKEIITRKLIVK